jgi:hypothetical protein
LLALFSLRRFNAKNPAPISHEDSIHLFAPKMNIDPAINQSFWAFTVFWAKESTILSNTQKSGLWDGFPHDLAVLMLDEIALKS